ncbi:isochorismate synthase [Evansella caseinilytica]|uniref:isochorismate synthase n=1 Tax=Evansella caseinilytica TaxID=1503961 RepID=A0A1H3SU67_9BACI|nr:isochorismate synthase DhbC [Evansella caseinilytica]SDZ41075.1 isochorismate synthase [Evansella caseinilytica]
MQVKTVKSVKAEQLLDEYKVGSSFFFASPSRTLSAEGIFATIERDGVHGEKTELIRRVKAALKQASQAGAAGNPLVVGAMPFDIQDSIHLFVPETVHWAGPLPFEQLQRERERSCLGEYEIAPVPAPKAYEYAVEQGLKEIASGSLEKIVLSRSLHLSTGGAIDVPRILRNLAGNNEKGYTFAVDVRHHRQDSQKTLLGASPELLVSRDGQQVTANPLAGSVPRSKDPEEDGRRAAALLASEKDRHEHAVVVEAVAQSLRPFCRTLTIPDEPSLVQTETMWHLSTVLNGELADPSVDSLTLALALHPTPAVCGTPTALAKKTIQELEPFHRGFFTGMVGWSDSQGNGEWIVTIRCAEAEARLIKLFAGAGIVAGSAPEKELAETSAKFRTMLQAMGLNDE